MQSTRSRNMVEGAYAVHKNLPALEKIISVISVMSVISVADHTSVINVISVIKDHNSSAGVGQACPSSRLYPISRGPKNLKASGAHIRVLEYRERRGSMWRHDQKCS